MRRVAFVAQQCSRHTSTRCSTRSRDAPASPSLAQRIADRVEASSSSLRICLARNACWRLRAMCEVMRWVSRDCGTGRRGSAGAPTAPRSAPPALRPAPGCPAPRAGLALRLGAAEFTGFFVTSTHCNQGKRIESSSDIASSSTRTTARRGSSASPRWPSGARTAGRAQGASQAEVSCNEDSGLSASTCAWARWKRWSDTRDRGVSA